MCVQRCAAEPLARSRVRSSDARCLAPPRGVVERGVFVQSTPRSPAAARDAERGVAQSNAVADGAAAARAPVAALWRRTRRRPTAELRLRHRSRSGETRACRKCRRGNIRASSLHGPMPPPQPPRELAAGKSFVKCCRSVVARLANAPCGVHRLSWCPRPVSRIARRAALVSSAATAHASRQRSLCRVRGRLLWRLAFARVLPHFRIFWRSFVELRTSLVHRFIPCSGASPHGNAAAPPCARAAGRWPEVGRMFAAFGSSPPRYFRASRRAADPRLTCQHAQRQPCERAGADPPTFPSHPTPLGPSRCPRRRARSALLPEVVGDLRGSAPEPGFWRRATHSRTGG